MYTELSLPPRIKVLEAAGAVAGGRVKIVSENEAEVQASEGERVYKVFTDLKSGVVSSDDNGTTFRNYVGYPIIAFMMSRGELPYDPEIGEALKDIKWRTLNEQYKSYRIVESIIKEKLRSRGVSDRRVNEFIKKVLEKLSGYSLRKPL
jgi:hypothetical protein